VQETNISIRINISVFIAVTNIELLGHGCRWKVVRADSADGNWNEDQDGASRTERVRVYEFTTRSQSANS
jgi:hypothetical protein